MKHKGDEDNMITKLRKSAHTSDLLGARGAGSLARGAADEIDRLRAEVKYWEDKEAHEGMSCYVDNKELDRLRDQVDAAMGLLSEFTDWTPGRGQVEHRRAGHGPCCTCQICGFAHDECVCEHNAIDLALNT